MEDGNMPQDKTLWKNNTQTKVQGGYVIGVSVYDRDNKPTSRPLMPGDTVWLTEDERILTANAPKLDKDNPFTNGDLAQVNEEFRPIGRSIGGGTTTTGEDAPRPEPVEAPAPDPATEPQAPAAPTPPPPGDPEKSQLPPDLRLGGDDGSDETPEAPAAPVQVVGDGEVQEVPEEHAAVSADATVAEEVGSAVPPAADPPVGEFAQHEEVGTPDAPAAEETADVPPPPPPPVPERSPDAIDQEQGLHALTPPPEDAPAKGEGGRFSG